MRKKILTLCVLCFIMLSSNAFASTKNIELEKEPEIIKFVSNDRKNDQAIELFHLSEYYTNIQDGCDNLARIRAWQIAYYLGYIPSGGDFGVFLSLYNDFYQIFYWDCINNPPFNNPCNLCGDDN